MKPEGNILLSHGNGGTMMHELIESIIMPRFSNPVLSVQSDAAIVTTGTQTLAFTTDSYVIDPVFFPGGNIGKLAVCGTVNDLAVSGADPLYISVSLILEEGLPIRDLEIIIQSISDEAKKAGVIVVTGDTKVVPKGKCDKLFINTSGIGKVLYPDKSFCERQKIQPGDLVVINGNIGDHGMAVLAARELFQFKSEIQSDCASLNQLIKKVLAGTNSVRFMRDPTRGGVATVLNEIVMHSGFGVEVDENSLPVNKQVNAFCELLGFELLHIANEGKVIMVINPEGEADVLNIMKNDPLGSQTMVIGRVTDDYPGKVILRTSSGGKRIIGPLTGDPLPRIC